MQQLAGQLIHIGVFFLNCRTAFTPADRRIRYGLGVWVLWLSLGAANFVYAAPARQAGAAAPGPECRELVVNGDFEQIGPGWSLLAGDYLPRYTNAPAYGGRPLYAVGFLGAA